MNDDKLQDVARLVEESLQANGLRMKLRPLNVKRRGGKQCAKISLDALLAMVFQYYEDVLYDRPARQLQLRMPDNAIVNYPVNSIWPTLTREVSLPVARGSIELTIGHIEFWPGAILYVHNKMSNLKDIINALEEAHPWLDEYLHRLVLTESEKEVVRVAETYSIVGVIICSDYYGIFRDLLLQMRGNKGVEVGRDLAVLEERLAYMRSALEFMQEREIYSRDEAPLQMNVEDGIFLPPKDSSLEDILEGKSVPLNDCGASGEVANSKRTSGSKKEARDRGEMLRAYVSLGCKEAWEAEKFFAGNQYIAFRIGNYIVLDTILPGNAVFLLHMSDGAWLSDAHKYKNEVRTGAYFVAALNHTSTLLDRVGRYLKKK